MSNEKKVLRQKVDAQLDAAMALVDYEITINDSIKFHSSYSDGSVKISVEFLRQGGEKGDDKNRIVKSKAENVFEKSLSSAPFLLDLNFFPL